MISSPIKTCCLCQVDPAAIKKANKDMQLLLPNNKKGQGVSQGINIATITSTNYYYHHSVLNDARLSQVRVAYSEVPSCSIGDSYNNLK